MRPCRSFPHFFVVLLILLASQLCLSQAKQGPSAGQPKKVVSGRTTFNSTCAACHGLDGRGSDKALNIATSPRVRAFSDAELASIISNGIPEVGMPAFRTLGPAQVHALVSYLRSLQGRSDAVVVSGNATQGKEIFFGKGECASCHSIAGKGGFLGPDLTEYAATNSPEGLRNEIIRSPRVPSHGYRPAVVTTKDGEHLEGLIRNEDNFSMQLQSIDGNFHLLRRSDLQTYERRDGSLMPGNYRERLSKGELDDLVSYLMKTPNPSRPATPSKKMDDYE